MNQISTSISATSNSTEHSEKIPTLWDTLSDDNNLSLLYPPLPDNYFENMPDSVFKPNLNPIESMYKKYSNDMPVKPYVTRRNLNAGDDTAPEKMAWEIGIKIDF